jgi:hypothetical protein
MVVLVGRHHSKFDGKRRISLLFGYSQDVPRAEPVACPPPWSEAAMTLKRRVSEPGMRWYWVPNPVHPQNDVVNHAEHSFGGPDLLRFQTKLLRKPVCWFSMA